MKKSSVVIFLTISLACAAFTVAGTMLYMGGWNVWLRSAFYSLAGVLAVCSVLFACLKRYALFKSAFLLSAFFAVFLAAFIVVNVMWDLDSYPTTDAKVDKLVEMLRSTGGWSMLAFVMLQIFQVVILPLPAAVCYLPGTVVFGPLNATLLASAGVITGSFVNYFIGKAFGRRVVDWIAGSGVAEKYSYIGRRGKTLFLIMQLLPFFPDDILCMVAGMSGMNFLWFSGVIIVARPLVVIAFCYLGSGTIIPFSGWGIAVWIVILVAAVALAVLSFKYQDRFEGWLRKKFQKKNKPDTEDKRKDV